MKATNLIILNSIALMALPLAAAADTSNANVYGTLNLSMENVSALGAADASKNYENRFRLASNSSNFGIKGTEELENGLKAIWQLEVSVNPSTGAQGAVLLRNSQLGLTGDFGTVFYGKWDTPFKTVSISMEPFYGTGIGYLAAILGTTGGGNVTSADVATVPGGASEAPSFDRRQGNSIQYWSPKLMGAMLKLAYSFNTEKTSSRDPSLFSASLGYDEGPLAAGVGYEVHSNFVQNMPAIATSSDTGFKAAAAYKVLDTTKLGVAYSIIANKQTAAVAETKTTRGALAVSLTHALDAITFRLGLAKANDPTVSVGGTEVGAGDGLGASMMSVGASYTLSKRTDLYAIASKIWNKNGNYNFIISGVNTGAFQNGSDPQGIGLGIRHTF